VVGVPVGDGDEGQEEDDGGPHRNDLCAGVRGVAQRGAERDSRCAQVCAGALMLAAPNGAGPAGRVRRRADCPAAPPPARAASPPTPDTRTAQTPEQRTGARRRAGRWRGRAGRECGCLRAGCVACRRGSSWNRVRFGALRIWQPIHVIRLYVCTS
jgi:hypothetical protein